MDVLFVLSWEGEAKPAIVDLDSLFWMPLFFLLLNNVCQERKITLFLLVHSWVSYIVNMCVCVCVCVWERERERSSKDDTTRSCIFLGGLWSSLCLSCSCMFFYPVRSMSDIEREGLCEPTSICRCRGNNRKMWCEKKMLGWQREFLCSLKI